MSRAVNVRPSAPHDSVAASEPKVSFGSWAFAFGPFADEPWSFRRVCSYVAEAGYDGIEINGFRPHPHPEDFNSAAKCRMLRDLIVGEGLGVSGFAPDMTAAPPAISSEASYARTIDAARAFCERVGITTLRVDSVSPPGWLAPDEYEQRFSRIVANFTQAAARLDRSGIQLVWEFEPGFWLNKPAEVLRLLDAVDHENFRVLFDTSHALTSARGKRHTPPAEVLDDDVVEFARLVSPRLGHLHLIDSVGDLHDDETSEHRPFGTGDVDFVRTIEALGPRVNELEWWTVDFCFWADTESDGVAAVPFVRDLISRTRHV